MGAGTTVFVAANVTVGSTVSGSANGVVTTCTVLDVTVGRKVGNGTTVAIGPTVPLLGTDVGCGWFEQADTKMRVATISHRFIKTLDLGKTRQVFQHMSAQ